MYLFTDPIKDFKALLGSIYTAGQKRKEKKWM